MPSLLARVEDKWAMDYCASKTGIRVMDYIYLKGGITTGANALFISPAGNCNSTMGTYYK